jgi:hypothetical protein
MKTIDCTPTWSNVLPILLRLIQNPNTHEDAVIELTRMAEMADAYIESQKTKDF